ncbi:hypothetical protein D3C85_1893690 [compost metagenome]
MGLLYQGLGVANHTGKEAANGLDHGQHGHFSAVEDVVTETYGPDREVFLRPIDDALVDAFVASAGEDQLLFFG